jgi:predicted ribosome quality control (RQC) complex YloA/Tae2 family protein
MANLDYSYISTELQPLVGRFFDKFYELRDGVFRLKFGRENIIIELGVRLHLTKYIEEAPAASNFTMKLRKELKGKKLSAISQSGKDRILIFDFEGTQVIAEMFGEGNLVLVREGKILAVYSRKKWKGRELVAHAQYSPPPSQTKPLEEILSASKAPIGAALRDLNIGMDYARLILAHAGIPDSKHADSLSKEEKNSIAISYKKLMETLSPKVIYGEENKPLAVSLFGEGKEFPTLSEALDEYYGIPTTAVAAEEEKGKTEENERLLRMLETQEKRAEELKKEAEEEKKSGDFIYQNYEGIQKILDLYKKGGMNSIEELANKKGWKLNKEKRELEIL